MEKHFYTYIMANAKNSTLYIGVTSNLVKRVYEHKNDLVEGFTKQYKIHNLVYFEMCDNAEVAIKREKQLKTWERSWKIALIEKNNPTWKDLYQKII